MGFFFSNPWGLFALTGVAAILVIHLLRRKSRVVLVSTLFLVERALPSSEGGRRIRTLRHSLPLWLQILAVVLLALWLAQLRWVRATSTQTVVAVFDVSASMSAFREETLQAAEKELTRLGRVAATVQWLVLRSDGSRLASGTDLGEVLEAVAEDGNPSQGTHDPGEAFRLARTLAGEKGIVVYFTDRPSKTADEVVWVASGAAIDNVGFLGAEATVRGWSALVKNFGSSGRTVRWRIQDEEVWRTVELGAGAMTELAGEFPAEVDRVMLELEGDRFEFDDRLPLLRPQEKLLAVSMQESENYRSILEAVARLAEPSRVESGPEADVELAVYSPLTPRLPVGAAVVMVDDVGAAGPPLPGYVVAENHALMEDLNWQGLMVRKTLTVPGRENDEVLLWQGGQPLIFLRTVEGKPQLVFAFDVRQSNAARLAAFPLLIHRFLDQLREAKQAYASANVETRQMVSPAGAAPVRAPDRPAFFAIRDGDGEVVFDGAAQFGDTRESDFRAATTARGEDSTVEAVREKNSSGSEWDPLWALALAGVMFWNWFLTGGRKAL